ncbi:cell wall metabolism sensor histidine kinase WalK [Sporosarcina pasteurii]|uniref:histidine kinase n=1 Tax=Sporosarcina pasteurii TaxID=1474 RepID=A0A380BN86_SPOPA|nr:HAMP domain-containing sensor histidine kinase [Sporosarcina pasteurii]MDS9470892.1 HAMP domain-containing sensor histidine kinase [Sporosarcina pasteurii]QBQ05448.1 HAMP domain-containing histidine kinase [Sporosarcina pasteurii]SUJ03169.1 Signal transduction histidine-protein kinase BaeS [Sporosarcina pasteurii]
MRWTLRSKILLYLLIVSFSGILLTSFSVLWGFENQFNQYLQKNREDSSSIIEKQAIETYQGTGILVNQQLANLMHQQAMTDHLYYRLIDENGQIVGDTTMMLGMMGHMGMHGRAIETEYQMIAYDLIVDDHAIGEMEVYFPKKMVGEEVVFIRSIKTNIFVAVIVTVILAILFSLLFAKRLTAGFEKLTKAIRDLQEHKLHPQVPVQELTDEMKPLAESFNKLAESLSKEEALRKQFTADFAHEIRTPLATLRSQIEAYQDGVFEPTPKRLQQSHDELMRLVRLVNEMEKLLAAENPQIKLQKTRIEVRSLLGLIEEHFTPSYLEKGVHLNIEKPTKECWFIADPDRVIQILTNIINNALQYTPAGNVVSVEIEESDDYLGFIICDEGTGIAAEDLPYLFERFYRGDKSRDRKTGGMGIGLSIVKALVDAHQGKIEIEGKLNVGTRVMIRLPKIGG